MQLVPHVFTGIVQKGIGRGKALGFPTANIPLEDTAVSGIFAALVLVDGKEYQAAAFADQKRDVLEAHLLDAGLDLYGKEISIEFLHKIRESRVFTDDAELRVTIAGDIAAVREYFKIRDI